MINMIAAMDANGGIGLNNKMPWHLPGELAYVKKVTMGHTLLMGRKTYESIGRPLPGRKNVILTTQQGFGPSGCEVVHSVDEALRVYKDDELFIFGGSEVYKLFMPLADRLYLTEIEHAFEVDTYFPAWDKSEWTEVSRTRGPGDEKNGHAFWFVVYERSTAARKNKE